MSNGDKNADTKKDTEKETEKTKDDFTFDDFGETIKDQTRDIGKLRDRILRR